MERFKINAKGRGTGEPNWPKPPFAPRKSVSKLVRDFLERTRDGTRQENEVDWLLVAIFFFTNSVGCFLPHNLRFLFASIHSLNRTTDKVLYQASL